MSSRRSPTRPWKERERERARDSDLVRDDDDVPLVHGRRFHHHLFRGLGGGFGSSGGGDSRRTGLGLDGRGSFVPRVVQSGEEIVGLNGQNPPTTRRAGTVGRHEKVVVRLRLGLESSVSQLRPSCLACESLP